jgi:Ca2+-binding EF-hand superfamily protein
MSGRNTVLQVMISAMCAGTLLSSFPSSANDMASFATGGFARGIQTESMMDKIDANHDGKISKEEWIAYQEKVWNALDKNRTGIVSDKQFLAPCPELVAFATGGYARGLQTREMMRKIDKDGDGSVSHEEFMSDQMALFDMMDSGKSGTLGSREFLGR